MQMITCFLSIWDLNSTEGKNKQPTHKTSVFVVNIDSRGLYAVGALHVIY